MAASRNCTLLLLAALTLSPVAGCRAEGDEQRRETLHVFAASSLTEAFQDLERGFEAAHPDVDVALIFAGSQVLRLQIAQGAEADVFASANEGHMAALVASGDVEGAQTFAHNALVVVVPPENPAGIASFADLARAERLVVGTPNVPVGRYAQQVLEKARERLGGDVVRAIEARIVSEESNVRLARAKVELGEADAAIVYRTDAVASDRVKAVAIPAELNVRASYPIGVVADSGRAELARRFVAWVRSGRGRAALERHGFETDPP